MPSVLVLGARNLGGAILDHLLSAGWTGAAVARSDDTLERVRSRGAIGLQADAADPEALRAAIARARSELDGLDLLVNAVSAARPPSGGSRGFGGGPIADATIEDWRGWGGAVAEQGFAFLSESARALRDQGRGGTIVQVTGAAHAARCRAAACGRPARSPSARSSTPPRRSCATTASTSRC
jgi:NAD(P)-dependent dehydrogenase (short-subunit alcohol dehydrogenase family)